MNDELKAARLLTFVTHHSSFVTSSPFDLRSRREARFQPMLYRFPCASAAPRVPRLKGSKIFALTLLALACFGAQSRARPRVREGVGRGGARRAARQEPNGARVRPRGGRLKEGLDTRDLRRGARD